MDITLFINSDPKNKINKTPSAVSSVSGVLRDQCKTTDPVIMIEGSAIPTGNYMYIPDFERYYFITNIKNVRNGLWEITAHVDVLTSYAAQIMAQNVILLDTSATGANNYVQNDVYVRSVKSKTDIVNFPSGLSEDGDFILITAGGFPTL